VNQATTVYVVIGCDVDPDRERLLGTPPGRLMWRGATEGIPAIKQALRGLTDAARSEPVFTWFLRADEQVRQMHGDYGWFARAHGAMVRSLRDGGDELGWHPHFWRFDAARGIWYQEILDVAWQLEMLRWAHRDLAAALSAPPRSVRMGWSYLNNAACAELDRLGIAVELSALPGLRTLGRRPLERGENQFDWYPTPREPYRPSQADYRRPAVAGEASLRLLEVPSFVATSVAWALIGGIQLTRKTKDPAHLWRAARRPTYCINVTARPTYFAPLARQLARLLRRGGHGPVLFATQFHADELVPNRSPLYDLASVRTNLEMLLRVCDRAATPLEFIPANRIPALCPSPA
jgi:hypothetical protein